MIKSRPLLNRETLFQHIDQKAIFEHYGQPYTTKQFSSTVRKDAHPSCKFLVHSDNTLLIYDYALKEAYNAIGYVAKKFNISYNDAMYQIHDDFKLSVNYVETKQIVTEITKSNKSIIGVSKQEFTTTDITYLKQFGITRKQCDFYNVFSIKYLFLNSKLFHVYNSSDPMIGYYFGTDEYGNERWKIYFYKRKKDTIRFICNTNRIAGWIQIPKEGDLLILTKSLKDVMVLHRMNYHAIAGQSENFHFYQSIIDELKQRFKQIVVIYDNDEKGILFSNAICSEFNLEQRFMLHKDISDQVKLTNYQSTLEYIQKLLTNDSNNNTR